MRHCLRYLFVAAGMLAGAALFAVAEGNVWSYEDSEGVTHFSNVPDNARYRLYLKSPGSYRLKPEFNSGVRFRTSSSRALTIGQDKLPFAAMVAAAATEQQQLDPALLHAIIHVESRHNPEAVSTERSDGLDAGPAGNGPADGCR